VTRPPDFDALLAVLDPEVVFRADRGPVSALAQPPVAGAEAVARQVLSRGARFAPLARPALVNGAAGLVIGSAEHPLAVIGFTVVAGRIVEIDLIVDRDKLRGVMRTPVLNSAASEIPGFTDRFLRWSDRSYSLYLEVSDGH